ncbi:hypothetical protein K523DRAFT_299099 [Schizophyllum commune Tattone D]|nr:hypothetical protein K525DRAFT_249100 [Schizophyllum commune Loenen D]KAI5832091.1 hypothetical protein K523DRAFT_299099 [Schizophyllum commune Tattone D]
MATVQVASTSILAPPSTASSTPDASPATVSPPSHPAIHDATILPPYSPARDAPPYTPAARQDERVLLAQPRRNDRDRPPTGHFLQQSGPISLVLFDQAEDATTPLFRQRADVRGTVGLAPRLRERASEVVVRIEGRLELAYSGGSAQTTRTVDDCYTIWSADTAEGCSMPPSEVGFCVPLPHGYTGSDGKTYTLPPTFLWVQHGTAGVFVRSYYRLRVLVYERPHGPFGLLAGSRRMLVPFDYRPRTRPVAPFFPLSCFFSTVKHMPEEWEETALVVEPAAGSKLGCVQCQLFLPAVKVFALSDKIPFHVLLSGRVDALRAFVPLDEVPSPSDCRKGKIRPGGVGAVRISIVREVIVEVRSTRIVRSERIGEGRIWPVPPTVRAMEDASKRAFEDCPCENADWEGELACRKDIITGGFTASGLWVQDVILLELTPLVAGTMQSVRKRVPIRLTTEPYTEPD